MSAYSISEFADYDTLTDTLRDLAAVAPELVTLSSIGHTREGRELWCVELAAGSGVPVDYRSALVLTATLHAQELAGSMISLHFLHHVVDRYGTDPKITRLLEEGVVYVFPRIAVDGAEYVLETRNGTIRSRHVKLAGRHADESNVIHPRDVDGDGRILTMRWPASDGDLTTMEEDSRLLVSRRDDETDGQFYRRTVEGLVPEYDGGSVVEPDTRSDFNRNFPSEAWRPFDWIGHGAYPLSEPEPRALADFLYDRPNVTALLDLHTGNPALFHPSNAGQSNPHHPADAALVEQIGERGVELTGFPLLSGYAQVRDEARRTELPGSLKDFAYDRFGIPAFVVELGMCYNYLGLETADLALPADEHERRWSRALIEWHERNPEYGLFHDWTPADHPQLGEVEIGGWDPLAWSNPPLDELDAVATRVTDFALAVTDWTPDVRVDPVDVTCLEGESDLYRLRATVENRGSLPTHLTQQGLETHTRAQPIAELSCDADCQFVAGQARHRIAHLEALGGRTSLEWVIRAEDGSRIELTVYGPRGVYSTRTLSLASADE